MHLHFVFQVPPLPLLSLSLFLSLIFRHVFQRLKIADK